MCPSPFLRGLVEPLDVSLQLVAIHAPDSSASDLDRGQLAGPNEGVDLGDADTQVCRHVLEREKPRFDPGRGLRRSPTPLRSLLGRHRPTLAPVGPQGVDLVPFARVCGRGRATASKEG